MWEENRIRYGGFHRFVRVRIPTQFAKTGQILNGQASNLPCEIFLCTYMPLPNNAWHVALTP